MAVLLFLMINAYVCQFDFKLTLFQLFCARCVQVILKFDFVVLLSVPF